MFTLHGWLQAALPWQRLPIASLALIPQRAVAELILDEFTDPVAVTSPAMANTWFETMNVGDVEALRRIRIASSSSDPIGTLDIGVTSLGQMTAQIDEIQRANTLTPISAVQFSYAFEPNDHTQAGRNDAILLDFVSLGGNIQPTFLRALVYTRHATNTLYQLSMMPEPTSSAQTVVFPFESFRTRDGKPGLDPATIWDIDFDFFFLGHVGELNWSARLERIRFGSTVVPESSTFVGFLWLPQMLAVARRRHSGPIENEPECLTGRFLLGYRWSCVLRCASDFLLPLQLNAH
jgi:hypothetical protein